MTMRWNVGSGFSVMGMDVCYLGRMLAFEREFEREGRPFSDRAIHFDLSPLRFDDGLDITEAEAETFYVVEVACMGAIKFFEDAALGLFAHAYSVVFDPDDDAFGGAVGRDPDQQVIFRIFDGVVDEVGDEVHEMHFIRLDEIALCIKL